MKPNPGGIITGAAIVDRDREIESIWEAIEIMSVILFSERRVGKSSVLRKIEENPRNDWLPILYWIEGKGHPIEFVEGLYELLLEKDVIKDRFHKLNKFYKKYVGGEQIGSWKLPQIKENWKVLLESLIEDIVHADNKILLMFDELPLMIFHFIQSKECGPEVGKEFLNTLREIRNKYESSNKIRFIFCGSIGIHLVIKDLKRNHGYNSDPINNMKIIPLSSMDKDGALSLCENLANGEGYKFSDKDKIFDEICHKTDRLPFYIQHVFDYMYERREQETTQETINEAIDRLLNDPKDQGFFRQYVDRIKTYYDKDIQELALLILNTASKEEDFFSESDILSSVKKHKDHKNVNDEKVKETLELIWTDHYLVRRVKDNKRYFKFKYSILQNWWKINKG